ncbi:MAG: DUF721 domain-containing protein [Bacteroidetes bacterium QS_8_64_10]|jgi:predicted nucleic acid-binding Zn ribbon protein|nr:MAG: DUF721 domain-containing protein [Bacteroidetes bacterium QS_8_64_10]
MPASEGPQKIGDVLGDVIDELGIRRELDEARVVETWATIAGPQINGVTESAWVNRQTLYVKLTSAAWRQELTMRRSDWRDRLNDELGSELVEKIVFR